MAWVALRRIIPKKIQQLGLEKVWYFSLFKDRWEEIIKKSVGDKFIGKSKPIKIKNEVLIVDCLGSVWANELRLREGRILEEVQRASVKIKIKKISFIS